MRFLIIGSVVVATLAAYAGNARAASFNCGRRLPSDMRMICNDPALNHRDSEAGALYDELSQRLSNSGRAVLQQEHLGFLRQRGQCRTDRACMMQAYDDQIRSLHSMFAHDAPPLRSTQPD